MRWLLLAASLLSPLFINGCNDKEGEQAQIIDNAYNFLAVEDIYGKDDALLNSNADKDPAISAKNLKSYLLDSKCSLISDGASNGFLTSIYDMNCLNFPENTILTYEYIDGIDSVSEASLVFKDKANLEPFLKQITDAAGSPISVSKTYDVYEGIKTVNLWQPAKGLQIIALDNKLSFKFVDSKLDINEKPVFDSVILEDTFFYDYLAELEKRKCHSSYRQYSHDSGILKVNGKCYSNLNISGDVLFHVRPSEFYKVADNKPPKVISSLAFKAGNFSTNNESRLQLINTLNSKYRKSEYFNNFIFGLNSDQNNILWISGSNNILYLASNNEALLYITKGPNKLLPQFPNRITFNDDLSVSNIINYKNLSIGETKINELGVDDIGSAHFEKRAEPPYLHFKDRYAFAPQSVTVLLPFNSKLNGDMELTLEVSYDDTVDSASMNFIGLSEIDSVVIRQVILNRMAQIYGSMPAPQEINGVVDYYFNPDQTSADFGAYASISFRKSERPSETSVYLSFRNNESILQGLILGVTKYSDYKNFLNENKCKILAEMDGVLSFDGRCLNVSGIVNLMSLYDKVHAANMSIICSKNESRQYVSELTDKYGPPIKMDYGRTKEILNSGKPDASWYTRGMAIDARYNEYGINLSYYSRSYKLGEINYFEYTRKANF